MERPIVDIGRVCPLPDITHSVHLLLVADIVFDRGDDPLALDPLDRLRTANRLQTGIRAEAFPIAATSRLAPYRAD